jgi:hypothetical protein
VIANAARARRIDGDWLPVRVVLGPPFAVVLRRADLTPGVYELQLVSTSPEGRESPRGYYRFRIGAN